MAEEGGEGPAGRSPGALVDAHVHLHEAFAVDAFVGAASRNFAQSRRRTGRLAAPGMLLLTESRGVRGFERLAEHRGGGVAVSATGEPETLRIEVDDEPPIHVVAGRQAVTRERLEVLALGTLQELDDGEDAATTIDRATAAGALAVLPWGFGKWTGARARRVRELLNDVSRFPQLLAGDNGGRPSGMPRPALLAEAERCGRLVIPGTDPLPLPDEVGKVGRFGFVADCALDPERPFRSLREWLTAQSVSPPVYGALERPGVFLRRQAALRLAR